MKNIIGTSVRLVLLATVALAWWLHPASLAAAVPVSVTYVQAISARRKQLRPR